MSEMKMLVRFGATKLFPASYFLFACFPDLHTSTMSSILSDGEKDKEEAQWRPVIKRIRKPHCCHRMTFNQSIRAILFLEKCIVHRRIHCKWYSALLQHKPINVFFNGLGY